MRYPRCFAVLNNQFNEQVAEQLLEMSGEKIYIPVHSKKQTTIDKEIEAIKEFDAEMKKRHDTQVVVFSGKLINAFQYMIISEFEPCVYWIDSENDSAKIQSQVLSIFDFYEMRDFLSTAEEIYAGAARRHYKITGEKVFFDKLMSDMFNYRHWNNVSNVEATVSAWMKSQLKVGILNRLDL